MKKIVITHASAGILLFVGSFQWIIALIAAESLVPDHSILINGIRDLISPIPLEMTPIQSVSLFFNISTILYGMIILISAIIIHLTYRYFLFTFFFSLSGLSMVGIGLFPPNTGQIPEIFVMLWCITTTLSAITGYFLVKKPVSYCSLFIGLFSLVIIILMIVMGQASPFNIFGKGGEERMLVYPLVIWILTLGGYLMGYPETFTLKRR